ncbi:MAG: glycosyltransferase family 2 protein [Dysosmobacter sp.]|nr:glycosyltransferase family 2 protein [Dysosmobacter sp.]
MEKLLTVILPAYNEEDNIHPAAETISGLLEREHIPFELLFVNDGSKDGTWTAIQRESALNGAVRGLRFSRNFGKESAIFAGLANARGGCAVVIDCDLQHPPEKIVEMYRLWEQGYEVVEGVKTDRGEESPFHAFAARCFYDLISKAVGIDMSSASDFKLLDRKAINALLTIREKNVFFRALSFWVGFKTTTVEFEVRERTAGSSKWSTRSLMRYAVNNITSFSAAPMQVVTVLGVLMLLISVILGVTTLVQKLRGTALGGFTTVIIIQLFTGSIIMISLGIIGYYIAKMYEEVKGRPKFIVAETCGEKNDAESLIG